MLIQSSVQTPWGTTDYIGTEAISASLSGPNTVVSGMNGYFIVVFGYLLVASGDVEVAFESWNGDVLSGPYDVAARGGNVATPASLVQFICNKNEDLILDLGGPIHVGGHISYGLIRGGH